MDHCKKRAVYPWNKEDGCSEMCKAIQEQEIECGGDPLKCNSNCKNTHGTKVPCLDSSNYTCSGNGTKLLPGKSEPVYKCSTKEKDQHHSRVLAVDPVMCKTCNAVFCKLCTEGMDPIYDPKIIEVE